MKIFRPLAFCFVLHLALHQRAKSHWIPPSPPNNTDEDEATTQENTTTHAEGVEEYSEAFKTCNKVGLKDDSQRFEWLSNGSVYFPTTRHVLNRTDFYFSAFETTLYVCSEILSPELNNTINEEEYSEAFMSCDHVDVPPQQSADGTPRYKFLSNGSVYFPLIDHELNRTDFVYNNGTLYVCKEVLNLFPFALKFPVTLTTVTIVGTALSAVCIVLHIAMFLAFEKLRNLPGYTLCSLCVALLAGYACVFAGAALPEHVDCTAIGIVKAYSLMAAFLWMNVMSFDIWRSLRMATNKLRLTADRGLKRRLASYSAYAWGVPLGVLCIGAVIHHSPGVNERYRMDVDPYTCWFRHRNALLAYFAAPIFTTIAANVLLFVASYVMIRAVGGGDVGEQRSRLVVSVRLAVAMGLVWVFAVLSNFTNQLWLSYLSVLFTILQGVFIFFSFSFTDKIKKEVRRAVQRRKDSSYPTQTSMHQMSTSA